MTKCNMCHGKGFISLGKGIRGVKKCEACRGSGNIELDKITGGIT